MKSSTSLVVLVAAAFAFNVPHLASAAESSKPAPSFTVTDISGKTHQLADYRGKIVVLEWLNPGCPFVLRHYKSGNMPDTQKVAAAQGAIWLQVNSTAMGDLDAAKTVDWQKKQGVIATAYIRDQDGKLGRLFGAQTTPHLFVIGPDGTLAYQGAIDDQPSASIANTLAAHNYVKAALASLKARTQKAQTDPYGCGVKYGAEQ
jgi:hypothetical protein